MQKIISSIAILILMAGILQADRQTNISDEWNKLEKNVLSGFTNMYNPHVIFEPKSEYPYKMWFFGWAAGDKNPGHSGCDAIFHARGKNLDSWEVYAGNGKWDKTMDPKKWIPVITAQDRIYDSWHNGDPSVVKRGNRYYMAYSATGYENSKDHPDGPKPSDIYVCSIMGATSRDGIHWNRTKEPILIHKPDLTPKLKGESSEQMHGMYSRPSLMFDDGKWKCWFDYWTEGGVSLGYAECPAGRFTDSGSWRLIRSGAEPALPNWPNPDVIKIGKKYISYSDPAGYDSHPWKGRHIAEAVSDDGINWQIRGHINAEEDTPATHVPEAFTLNKNGKTEIILFYSCQIGGDPYDYRYDRIRYMRRWADTEK